MSDNELDAELLALAGGESSSEDEQPQQAKASVSDKHGEKAKSRMKTKAKHDSDQEEGEASDYGPTSPRRKTARDQTPSDGGDDADMYPVDGLFRSAREKTEIMGMTEVQREEILAERAAEAQRRTQDQQLKCLLQAQRQQPGSDDKKRKAGAADLDDGQRKSNRQKTKTKSTDTLDAYKRQRELKGAQRSRGEGNRRDTRSSEDRDMSEDRDAQGESEVEWDDGKPRRSPEQRVDDAPPGLSHFNKYVWISREKFAKFHCYPNFEERMRGCYVRVRADLKGYRMGEIRGFKQGQPYQWADAKGKMATSDQYVLVGFGNAATKFSFAACSNDPITDYEFGQYERAIANSKSSMPSRRQLSSRLESFEALVNHTFTNADIEKKVEKANELKKKFREMGREKIVRRKAYAKANGDEEAVARLEYELAAYDAGFKVESKTSSQDKPLTQQERLAVLNRVNRKKTSEEVRRVQLAEKEAARKARDARVRLKAEEAEKAMSLLSTDGEDDDLFGEDQTGKSASGADTPKGKIASRSGTPIKGIKREKGSRKSNMDDDIMASMDLGIEIDI